MTVTEERPAIVLPDTAAGTGTGTVSANTPGRPPAERTEPVWMLRVNPLRRTRLADPALAGVLDELARVEAELALRATACTDALYEWIGAAPADERAALVAVRRAVHNDRVPATLPDPAPAEFLAWLELRVLRDGLLAEAAEEHPRALARERGTLSGLLGDEDLLRSLALLAPEVHRAAVRYREGTLSRAAKSERGLLQYVTRAMMRTSPLARFTAVGLAVPSPDGARPDEVAFTGARSFPHLDQAMLGYVARTADQGTPPGPDTWVRQSPSLSPGPGPDRISFVKLGDDSSRLLSTSLTEPLRRLLNATDMGPRTVGAIAGDVARALGTTPEQATGVVLGSLNAGLLCTTDGPEDCADDPLAAAPHAALRAAVAGFADAGHAERADALRGIGALTSSLTEEARRPAAFTVSENYLLAPAEVATSGLDRQLRDLAHAMEFLSAFDRLHDIRAVLTDVFVERYGRGASVRLTDHARHLVRTVNERVVSGSDSLTPLRLLRTRLLGELRADLAGRRDDTEVVWPAEWLAELAAPLPDRFRQDAIAYSALVQPAGERLVFNDSYPGHGMLYGRFLGHDAELGGHALPRLRRRLQERHGAHGTVLAEDRGLHGVSVNAHAPVLDRRLRADDWYGLRLVHDPDLDRLYVADADGRRLHVLTLGTGHPELLPPPLRLANWLVMGGRLLPDLGMPGGLGGPGPGGVPTAPDTPRLCAGSVVLQRRRWYPGEEFEQAVRQGPGEADRMLALTRWRARHGVPAEVVLKPAPFLGGGAEPGSGRSTAKQRKPQYVDLTSALLTRALPRFLDRDGSGFVEEALPAAGASPHAYEWAVEISRPSGGRFTYTRPGDGSTDDREPERHRHFKDQGEQQCG
ncbi:hypothetical protein [Streptomyces sp. NBC_01006]|uniref:hypothetical protein n=1 Tax=Streptomyces sp. NBC_01006 TaxID=2903716 RepID=UPI0038692D09|nr:lantibiotic dehydratase family protein [Streptomyces sp. NBC_01006]